ncbi:signal peptidase I [Ruminiclostridium cellobioparum]|uniref:Signal peptidase I n=1 Tax=Ruminiclostridium cellobioparum subsp. termitidis CT1112 TaxID=1195236 RepID=S0FLE4_RUMCE|nr:signal peptidase I [Ruminiclostridium cellobioparum]EMS71136.1 signal peptidase I, bacterial type [Ruminiclostridium cellobioparum subsp. termitidis CT1112]
MENQNYENNEEKLEKLNTENKDKQSSDIKPKKKNSIGREIFEWAVVIVAAVLISMLIKAFIFSTYQVNMVSMENTLFEGHNVIVYKTGYFFSEPSRGDIIVFMHEEGQFKSIFKYLPIRNPGEVDYIKRVIGLPGDQIDIHDGFVYRKAAGESEYKKLEEPYVKGITESKGMQLPFTVPENKLFVMGDNREQSLDSRSSEVGPIDVDSVIGRAVLRIWPLAKFGGLK